ncbi:hypothetical protein BV898_19964, partial [Hypsibius exemplaris]
LEKPTIASPKILSVKIGEDFPVSPNRTMRPFRTTHRVPSNGYLIYKQEKSLLPQFYNLTGHEIGALVAAGGPLDAALFAAVVDQQDLGSDHREGLKGLIGGKSGIHIRNSEIPSTTTCHGAHARKRKTFGMQSSSFR